MLSKVVCGVRQSVVRSLSFVAAMLAVLVMTGSELFAQTSGSSLPDIAEIVAVPDVTTKLIAWLAIALASVIMLKLGISALLAVLSFLGFSGRRRAV